MKDIIEKFENIGVLTTEQLKSLTAIVEAGFCSHRSWGVGKIVRIDDVKRKIYIDFEDKPNHAMDVAFASDTLRPVAATHILARRMTELEALQDLADKDPLKLVKEIMASFGNRATIEQIENTVVPSMVHPDDWKTWWTALRVKMKKCGNFLVPTRKVEPIIYQPEVNSLQERYLNDFQKAKGFKQKLTLLAKILQNLDELDDASAVAKVILPSINQEIEIHKDGNPALALEGVFARDEFKKALKITDTEAITAEDIWATNADAAIKITEELPLSSQVDALVSIKKTFPDTWQQLFLSNLNRVSTKLCEHLISELLNADCFAQLSELLRSLITQHQADSNLLLWFAKSKQKEFKDLANVQTFRAMIAAIERDQFNNIRSNKLRDTLQNDTVLLDNVLAGAKLDEVRELTRAIQNSTAFGLLDKRSLLGQIVQQFPEIQSLITGGSSSKQKQSTQLIVSWESLERKKEEYEILLKERIPANTKEIEIARGYGDLRENSEYKFAREQQKLLQKLKAEMESDLDRARGTDFKDVNTDVVGIGTKMTVKDQATQECTTYCILGAWDFDEAKNIISYLSPLAQIALNKKVGENIEFNDKKYVIERIDPAVV